MPRQKNLNTRQLKFCRNYVLGDTAGNISQSHRKAGYACPTIEGHGANGIRLLKSERIQKEIAKLREKSFEKDALTFAEKRAFLARAVRADASSPDADLVQEIREEVDSEGRIKRVRKMVGKLEALSLDNKMIGDNFADRTPQASNPFLLIVSLGKTTSVGEMKEASLPVRLPDATRDEPSVIDAELVG